jgi:integrase
MADVDVHGKRIRRACRSQIDAEMLERKLRKELLLEHFDEAPEQPDTLHWLLNQCIAVDWGEKHSRQAANAFKGVQFFGLRSHPRSITTAGIDEYVSFLRKNGFRKPSSNSTIRSYLSPIKVMLKRAQRLGLIDVLPLFPEARTLPMSEPRDLVLDAMWIELQADLMVQWDKPVAADLVRFLHRMGCRVREALALRWENIDSRGNVQFINTKGKKPRRLPMPPDIKEMMQRNHGSTVSLNTTGRFADCPRNVCPFSITYIMFYEYYSRSVDEVCDRLHLSKSVRDSWVIHTLRHTRITELAYEGWSAFQLMQWSGHASMSTTERYLHGSGIFPEFDQ